MCVCVCVCVYKVDECNEWEWKKKGELDDVHKILHLNPSCNLPILPFSEIQYLCYKSLFRFVRVYFPLFLFPFPPSHEFVDCLKKNSNIG